MEDATDILISQYEQAVLLYQHEDSLTWHKIQQAVYVNGAIATVIGIELVQDNRWVLAAGASLLNILFVITVEGSRRYMFARLNAVREGERALCERIASTPLIVAVKPPRFVPATSFAIRVFLGIAIIVWLTLTLYWIL